MSRTISNVAVWPLRTLPKDIGVAILVVVALAGGLLLRLQVEGGTKLFHNANPAFSIAYPATWRVTNSADGAMFRVENAQAASVYKTNLTIESRELDPASLPTLQELIDRRVTQRSTLTGYHFLSNSETTVAGARAAKVEYASVVQPLDAPRRASLPVVTHSREYIVVTRDRSFYITLAAPENDFARASEQFDRMVESVKLQ